MDDLALLHTKLYRPPPAPDLVPRPRLLERLDRCHSRPLTLIAAPAGYGKTTLASSWLQHLSEATRPCPAPGSRHLF